MYDHGGIIPPWYDRWLTGNLKHGTPWSHPKQNIFATGNFRDLDPLAKFANISCTPNFPVLQYFEEISKGCIFA